MESQRILLGFSGGSDGKESTCNLEDPGLIPGSERFPEEGNGNPLQREALFDTVTDSFKSPHINFREQFILQKQIYMSEKMFCIF